MVKFMHFRGFDSNDNLTSEGGRTVAYEIDGNAVRYAVARCHTSDRYIKKVGRRISEQRLRSDEYVRTIPFVAGASIPDLITDDLVQNTKILF